MLNDEICKLREKLNKSILAEKDYSIIYSLSLELDELIAKYYNVTDDKLENRESSTIYGNKLIEERYVAL